MKDYRWTITGLAAGLIFFLASVAADMDVFEFFVRTLASFEAFELDELILPAGIFLAFVPMDIARHRKDRKVEMEKIRIYRAMMASTHHILNNFLNQVQLFKMAAEETPGFDPEILSFYDLTIDDAEKQLTALGSLTEITEAAIQASVAPQVPSGA